MYSMRRRGSSSTSAEFMLAHGDLYNALLPNPEMTALEGNVGLLRLRPQLRANQGVKDTSRTRQ